MAYYTLIIQSSIKKVQKEQSYHYRNYNLYFKGRAFKEVLAYQLGADLRYHTKYNAMAYMPAIAQSYLQDEQEVGGFTFSVDI